METILIVKDLFNDKYISDRNTKGEVVYTYEVSEAWKFLNTNETDFKEFMKWCKDDYVMLTIIEVLVL